MSLNHGHTSNGLFGGASARGLRLVRSCGAVRPSHAIARRAARALGVAVECGDMLEDGWSVVMEVVAGRGPCNDPPSDGMPSENGGTVACVLSVCCRVLAVAMFVSGRLLFAG